MLLPISNGIKPDGIRKSIGFNCSSRTSCASSAKKNWSKLPIFVSSTLSVISAIKRIVDFLTIFMISLTFEMCYFLALIKLA